MPSIRFSTFTGYRLVGSSYPTFALVVTLLLGAGFVAADEKSPPPVQSMKSLDAARNVSDDHDSPAYRMLKSIAGPSGLTRSDAEKAAAQDQFFAGLAVMLPLMDACGNDINNICKQEKNPTACLVANVDSLEKCCASQVRSVTGDTALPNITFHNDVLLPVGSSLDFDSSCTISKATLIRDSYYQSTKLSAGPAFFTESGEIELTQLTGSTKWQGLNLADQQPPTRIFSDGTPQYIRLTGQNRFNEVDLSPMQLDIRNSIETTEWKRASLDDIFYFFEMSGVSRDPGTTMFHTNGKLARGNLTNSAIVNGVPLASGISTFATSGKVLTGALSDEYEYGELTLAKGPVVFNTDGQLISARLAKAHLTGDLMLAADEITFHDNGELKNAFIPAGALINANPLPRKARITLDESGTLQTLAISYGDPLRSSWDGPTFEFGEYRLRPNMDYAVHDTGQLKESQFEHHRVYRGKLYPGRTAMKFDRLGEVTWDSFYDKALHNEYEKQRGMLPEVLPISQVRQGVFLPKGSIVYSGYYGNVERAIISRPVRFKEMIMAVSDISFSRYGAGLANLHLHGDQVIDGVKFEGFPESVNIDEQGQVTYGQLAGDQLINGIWFADQSKINLNPDRTPLQGTLARDSLLNGITLKAGFKTQFHKNGFLKHGQLAADFTQSELTFKKESDIYLDVEGNIVSGTLAHDHNMLGTIIPVDSNIELNNGKLNSLNLKHAINIQGFALDGRGIEFRDDGSLRTGILSIDSDIGGELVSAGTQLLLDPTGLLLGTDFVGLLAPAKPEKDHSANASATDGVAIVTMSSGPVRKILLSPPTSLACDKLFSGDAALGYASNGVVDTLKRKCQSFYAEYQE